MQSKARLRLFIMFLFLCTSVPATGAAPAIFVATAGNGGSDSNDCLAASNGGGHGPCLTLQHATAVAMNYNFGGSSTTVNIGTGTFQGTAISGYLQNPGSNVNTEFLILNGNGSANTTINDTGSHTYVLDPSGGMQIILQNMNISVPANETGIFAQLPGTFVLIGNGVTFTGQAVSSIAIHVEDFAAVSFPASQTLTTNGSFGYFLTAGFNGQAGFVGTINCGTATFGTVFALVDGGSLANFANTWSGCGAVTGIPYSVKGNSLLVNTSGTPLPGNTTGIVDSGGRYRPASTPTVLSATGLGTGGTATVSAGSGSHGGIITLNTGTASTAASGAVTIAMQELQIITGGSVLAPCTATLVNFGATWTQGSTWNMAQNSPNLTVNWSNNGVALTASQTYRINYVCNGDF